MRSHLTVMLIVVCGMTIVPGQVGAQPFPEGFESGYAIGSNLADHPDWWGQGSTKSPTIEIEQGVAGSIGLSPAQKDFYWTARSFTWTDPTLDTVTIKMDFETAASGDANFPYNSDRMGWTINQTSIDSNDLFCVTLSDTAVKTYWCNGSNANSGSNAVSIVTYPAPLSAQTFYRLAATFKKLTDTSVQIDVSLTELDSNGGPVGTPITGQIADTSLLDAKKAPNAKYFTAVEVWPAFKNYNEKAVGNADNAYLEVTHILPPCAATVDPQVDQFSVADVGEAAAPSAIDYTVTNEGASEITYEVVELDEAQQETDVPWLSKNKTGGTISSLGSDVVTASISTTGLGGGRYTAYLKFTDNCDPPVQFLRKITLDMYGCHWTVDSCSQERAYQLDYPTVLPEDVVYRITNTGTSSMNYTVAKSGDSECFEWLVLTNPTGSINAGQYVDVVAHIDVEALAGHDTDEDYFCTLTFSDGCSPQVETRRVKLQYEGVGDTAVFVYDGSVPPTNDNSAGPGLRFDLDSDFLQTTTGAVETDPGADNHLVWRITDPTGTTGSWYQAVFLSESSQWERLRERGEVGSTMLARMRVRSWGPTGGTRRAIIAIAEQYASSCGYHWGGPDGVIEETKRIVGLQSGIGSDGFVTVRLTSNGSEDADEWTCGRTVRLYLNEDPTPVIEILDAAAKGTATSGDRGFWFGDSSGSSQIDVSFDWVTGTNAGAFAPGEEVAVLGRSLVPTFQPCPIPFADADRDQDVDQVDFALLQSCLTGDGGSYDWETCHCWDRDSDEDIDDEDQMAFEACATGPGVPFDVENPPEFCIPY